MVLSLERNGMAFPTEIQNPLGAIASIVLFFFQHGTGSISTCLRYILIMSLLFELELII